MTFETYFTIRAISMNLMVVFLAVITKIIENRMDSAERRISSIQTRISILKSGEEADTKRTKRKIKWQSKSLTEAYEEYQLLQKRYIVVFLALLISFVVTSVILLITKPYGRDYEELAILITGAISAIVAKPNKEEDRSGTILATIAILVSGFTLILLMFV